MYSKKIINNIKEKLLKEKHECLYRLSQKHDIDSDGDETDEVQANIQIDLNQKFIKINKFKLLQIEEALARINNKTYGVCVDCEEPIIGKRLLANPYCVTCVDCAEDRETQEKRKGL